MPSCGDRADESGLARAAASLEARQGVPESLWMTPGYIITGCTVLLRVT